ncbi:MAG: DUF6266 family protein [Flavobacterium sp.]
MAEIKDGILGGVQGKVGTVVGYNYRGKKIIRSLPDKSIKPATKAQILQRSKLTVVVKFLKGIKDFVNVHYPEVHTDGKIKTGYDQIRSEMMTNGLEVKENMVHILPERVILSIGVLTPATIQKINFLKDDKVKVRWDDTLINALTNANDQLTMIAFHDELNEFHTVKNIAKRTDKYTHFELPEEWEKGTIHFWSVWVSTEKSINSTSNYHYPLTLERTK